MRHTIAQAALTSRDAACWVSGTHNAVARNSNKSDDSQLRNHVSALSYVSLEQHH